MLPDFLKYYTASLFIGLMAAVPSDSTVTPYELRQVRGNIFAAHKRKQNIASQAGVRKRPRVGSPLPAIFSTPGRPVSVASTDQALLNDSAPSSTDQPTTNDSAPSGISTVVSSVSATTIMSPPPKRSKSRHKQIAVAQNTATSRVEVTADEMRVKSKADRTLYKYKLHWKRFRTWLLYNGREEMVDTTKDAEVPAQLFQSIFVPIPLEVFDAFLDYYKYDDQNLLKAYSTVEGFWNSLTHAHKYFCDGGVPVPDGLVEKWHQFKEGYKRMYATQANVEGLTSYEGKDSLTRKGFVNLQALTLDPSKCNISQMLWVPQMNAMSRNLVARINSIGQLNMGRIRWKNDCLCITFGQHKGDQTAERSMERHVHGNPLDPLSCALFWLGIRVLSCTASGLSHFLFGDELALIHQDGKRGSSCKDKAFGSWMVKVMSSLSIEDQYRMFDGPAKDFGTHSNRKGGLEELTTTPDGAPPIACLLRAGFSIGDVLERYIKEMNGGDELCSRVCAGFDLHSPDFSLLPPHFPCEFIAAFDWSMIVCNYECYPECFKTVIPFLVASVCYQVKTGWVAKHFPPQHPLFGSTFWRSGRCDKIIDDTDILTGHLFCPVTGMRATGIPHHHVIGKQVGELVAEQSMMRAKFEECIGGGDGASLAEHVSQRVTGALDIKLESTLEMRLQAMEKKFEATCNRLIDFIDLTQPGTLKVTCVLDIYCYLNQYLFQVMTASSEPLAVAQAPIMALRDTLPPPPPTALEDEYSKEVEEFQKVYFVYSWRRGSEVMEKLHPTKEPFEFPGKLQVN